MKVLDLMNNEENWEEVLQQSPYFINIKKEDDYVLLKYNQLFSDFSNEIVRECRGAIFRKQGGRWVCVCRAFNKFGNYGESYAPKINWENAAVIEKIDGSLIKFFYDNEKWHIATNGQIDAFEISINDEGLTFGDLVLKALGGQEQFSKLTYLLDRNFTYMFELVSPITQVVIPYPNTELYYLGARDMITMREDRLKDNSIMGKFGIKQPKYYATIHDIEECIRNVNEMSKDNEGFVVVDDCYNRIKVKSPEYLRAAKLNNNNKITIKRVVEMMREEQLDDFIAYCPQHEEMVNKVIGALKEMEEECAKEWEEVKEFARKEKKEFVSIVKNKCAKWPNYLYWKYSNSEGAPSQFLGKMSVKTITDLIRKKLDEKSN